MRNIIRLTAAVALAGAMALAGSGVVAAKTHKVHHHGPTKVAVAAERTAEHYMKAQGSIKRLKFSVAAAKGKANGWKVSFKGEFAATSKAALNAACKANAAPVESLFFYDGGYVLVNKAGTAEMAMGGKVVSSLLLPCP